MLFLAHRMPLPMGGGESARAWHMLRHLAASHRVHVGCLYESAAEADGIAKLGEICASVMAVRRRRLATRLKSGVAFVQGRAVSPAACAHPRLQRWVAETMAAHQPSAAFVSHSGMAPYLDPYQFSRRIIDMIALGSERWRRAAETSGWPKSELCWRQERVLLAHERQVAARCDDTLFASAAEANLFLRRAPRAPARILALRNGVDQDFFDPARDYANPYRAGRRSVVFAGALDYAPNIEAAVWFATEVMTMLRHRVPTLDFWIVGARPSRAIRALARRDIHLKRDPADIRPYLAHADAVLAPLRVARGIENTVLEGMAMGKPVVATPAALDGFDFAVGEEIFCSASAPGFASGVVAALGEKGRAAGERARRRIDADYGWAAALRRLDAALGEERPVVAAAS
jgi:sugar transferase (PEP-CTERM/EpsH1 system associated)